MKTQKVIQHDRVFQPPDIMLMTVVMVLEHFPRKIRLIILRIIPGELYRDVNGLVYNIGIDYAKAKHMVS